MDVCNCKICGKPPIVRWVEMNPNLPTMNDHWQVGCNHPDNIVIVSHSGSKEEVVETWNRLNQDNARIRAEARAEALKEAASILQARKDRADETDEWWEGYIDGVDDSLRDIQSIAILADEPKEERGAEVGDIVWCEPKTRWDKPKPRVGVWSDDKPDGDWARVVVLMRRAEVERRIEEGGR